MFLWNRCDVQYNYPDPGITLNGRTPFFPNKKTFVKGDLEEEEGEKMQKRYTISGFVFLLFCFVFLTIISLQNIFNLK